MLLELEKVYYVVGTGILSSLIKHDRNEIGLALTQLYRLVSNQTRWNYFGLYFFFKLVFKRLKIIAISVTLKWKNYF